MPLKYVLCPLVLLCMCNHRLSSCEVPVPFCPLVSQSSSFHWARVSPASCQTYQGHYTDYLTANLSLFSFLFLFKIRESVLLLVSRLLSPTPGLVLLLSNNNFASKVVWRRTRCQLWLVLVGGNKAKELGKDVDFLESQPFHFFPRCFWQNYC